MTRPQQKQQPVIQKYLKSHKSQIAAALPKHLDADRMARIAMTECRKTPQLLSANPQSLFGAIIQCSQLGLEPGNALGHAYLLPFKNNKENRTDVQLIIGYRGMIDLARRSGQIVSLTARAVYEQDQFHYEFGLHEDLKHVPSEEANRGELTHAYAVARLKDGGIQWEVMPKVDIEAVRNQSKAGKSGPWVTHYEEMAKKTVIRRLFKYLPVSIEMQRATGLDEQAEAGVGQDNAAVIEGEWDAAPEQPQPAGARTLDDGQQNQIQAAIEENGADKAAILNQLGVGSIAEIPAAQFSNVLARAQSGA